MWNHAPFMEARMKELGMSWPIFEKDETPEPLAYLTSLPAVGASKRSWNLKKRVQLTAEEIEAISAPEK